MNRMAIYQRIDEERERQEARFGGNVHDWYEWLPILMEELGEAARAMLTGTVQDVERELIHAAAVIVAMIEQRIGG